MNIFLALFTCFAYIFIVAAYTYKIVKYLCLPVHLRWELYPVIHEEKYRYGGSYLERIDWWNTVSKRHFWRGLSFLLKDYLFMVSYFKWRKTYWVALYVSHISFILLMFFQLLVVTGAVLEAMHITVSDMSVHVFLRALYFVTILTGITSFAAGIVGVGGLYIKRLIDPDLNVYATPIMYVGYAFNMFLSFCGLYAWYSVDRDFSGYRMFWLGLLHMSPIKVELPLALFIIILNLHLVYLPFTRAMHYITRLFAFFFIRWDDRPNFRGGSLEKEINSMLGKKVTWSAPHIQSGKTWSEAVKNTGDDRK